MVINFVIYALCFLFLPHFIFSLVFSEGPREVLCCKYNEEFDYLAGGSTDGVIRLYNANKGDLVFSLTDDDVKDNRAPVTSIQHRPVSKNYPTTNSFTVTCKFEKNYIS